MAGYSAIPRIPLPNGWLGRVRRAAGDRFRLAVGYVEGRKHLPVIELRRAAFPPLRCGIFRGRSRLCPREGTRGSEMAIVLIGAALVVVIATAVGLMLYSDKRELDRVKNLHRVD